MSAATLPSVRVVQPESSVELVDPATAHVWLGKNPKNRNLRRGHVAALARDMTAGQWRFTGEPIKFAQDGSLLDGQHRLHALIQADVSLSLLIVHGLESEAQDVMDTGARRTAGDALNLHGEKNSALLASAAAMVLTEGNINRRRATTSEVIEAIEQDESIRMIGGEVLPRLKLGSITSGSVAFYAYWKLHQINARDCALFFDSLSSLVGLEAGSPVLALHRRLLRAGESSGGRGSHAYRQEALAVIFSAWNAYRAGLKREKIQVTYGSFGRIQIPEPK